VTGRVDEHALTPTLSRRERAPPPTRGVDQEGNGPWSVTGGKSGGKPSKRDETLRCAQGDRQGRRARPHPDPLPPGEGAPAHPRGGPRRGRTWVRDWRPVVGLALQAPRDGFVASLLAMTTEVR
jgi:hypothetical protein